MLCGKLCALPVEKTVENLISILELIFKNYNKLFTEKSCLWKTPENYLKKN
jgi:hypothetical protein